MDKTSKDKQYKTRDGREVRIYATDGLGVFPIHGAVKNQEGWTSFKWCEDGMHLGSDIETGYDLIEVKQQMKFERWYLFTSQGDYSIWQSKPDASSAIDVFAIKHIVFEVEEGEGLDAV